MIFSSILRTIHPFVSCLFILLAATLASAEVTLETDGEEITSLAFSPDGEVVAAGTEGGTVVLWETETGKEIKKTRLSDREIKALLFTQDSKKLLVVGYFFDTVTFLDSKTGKMVHQFSGRKYSAGTPVFSEDGKQVVVITNSKNL